MWFVSACSFMFVAASSPSRILNLVFFGPRRFLNVCIAFVLPFALVSHSVYTVLCFPLHLPIHIVGKTPKYLQTLKLSPLSVENVRALHSTTAMSGHGVRGDIKDDRSILRRLLAATQNHCATPGPVSLRPCCTSQHDLCYDSGTISYFTQVSSPTGTLLAKFCCMVCAYVDIN